MAHILTDTTSQVNKQAETFNQGGPLAITKLDMQQKSMMITIAMMKKFQWFCLSSCALAALISGTIFLFSAAILRKS